MAVAYATIRVYLDSKAPLKQRGFYFMNKQIPKYAHLEYQVLHELEISIAEYFLLDMIFRLSGNGTRWCNKKIDNIAFDMRMSKRGVIDLRNRLIEKKLLKKGVGNRLLTSEKVQKVYFLDEDELQKVQKVPQKVQKLHSKSAESVSKTSVENNKRITENNAAPEKKGNGYELFQAQRDRLKRKFSGG